MFASLIYILLLLTVPDFHVGMKSLNAHLLHVVVVGKRVYF